MNVTFSSNKKNDATIENHVKLPYAASKRAFPKVRWFLILLIVFSPFILFLGKIALDWIFVTSPGTIWLEKRIINANETGTVEKVFYRKGDTISPDTAILRVQHKIPEGRLEQLAFLEAERDAASVGAGGTFSTAGGSSGIASELAQENLAYYEQARNNIKWLVDQGAATGAELDLAENRVREAKAALMAANSSHGIASAVDPTRIMQVEQSIRALKTMNNALSNITLGEGWQVHSIFVSEGQSFSAGEPLAVVMNKDQIHVVTYVEPADFKKINIGTVASVKIPGTGRKIKAVVEQPPVVADNVPSGIAEKMYPITMRGVQIFLKVLEPLQENEMIEGLPVVVSW